MTITKLYNDIMQNKPKYDRFYQLPERAILYAFNNLSNNALRLYIVLAGQKSEFLADIDLYCRRAQISMEQYEIYEKELIEKGFLSKDNEIIRVTCPLKAYTLNYDTVETKEQPKIEELNIKDLI